MEIWKKSKLNREKIGKIWRKGKLNSETIWKIWKKPKLNSQIFSLFNLLFFHIFHIISQFNLLFFSIFHIFSLFNLLFFHIFPNGNLCLVDVNLAKWQHFTKCIIKYVLNTCVIVYLLQYLVSVVIISETMKTIQHQEVDSECLWHPLYHPTLMS
jgi:hypothetical protein